MLLKTQRQRQAKWLRAIRKIHRTLGIFLFLFFIIVSLSGLLLGWKKHTGDLLLPQTRKGSTVNFKDWLPLDNLHQTACNVLRDSVSTRLSLELEKIDIRKDKGIVKFVFKEGFWEIQIDGTTGKLLHIGKRHSDLIEKLHDGSILDSVMDTSGGQIKLIYTSIMGFALLTFSITGFWLWYGPKRMKKKQ
ncbi:MAG: PepSY domain-containing protein [Opitutaceae bacterium]|nr:PepSY domain-containing protein [Cytophagales bacterium]